MGGHGDPAATGGESTSRGYGEFPERTSLAGACKGTSPGGQPAAATEACRGPGADKGHPAATGGKMLARPVENGRVIAAAGEGPAGATAAAGCRSSAGISVHASAAASSKVKRVCMDEAAKVGRVKVKLESELPAAAAAALQVVVPLSIGSSKQASAGKHSLTSGVGNGRGGCVSGFEGLVAAQAESAGSPPGGCSC